MNSCGSRKDHARMRRRACRIEAQLMNLRMSDETTKVDRRVRSVSKGSIRQEAPCLSRSFRTSSSSSMLHLLSRTRDPFEDPTKFALPRAYAFVSSRCTISAPCVFPSFPNNSSPLTPTLHPPKSTLQSSQLNRTCPLRNSPRILPLTRPY